MKHHLISWQIIIPFNYRDDSHHFLFHSISFHSITSPVIIIVIISFILILCWRHFHHNHYNLHYFYIIILELSSSSLLIPLSFFPDYHYHYHYHLVPMGSSTVTITTIRITTICYLVLIINRVCTKYYFILSWYYLIFTSNLSYATKEPLTRSSSIIYITQSLYIHISIKSAKISCKHHTLVWLYIAREITNIFQDDLF